MGGSRISRINLKASLKEEISNGNTVLEVSARIKLDILARDITFTTMEKKPEVEKVTRWCLGGEAFSKEMTCEGVARGTLGIPLAWACIWGNTLRVGMPKVVMPDDMKLVAGHREVITRCEVMGRKRWTGR